MKELLYRVSAERTQKREFRNWLLRHKLEFRVEHSLTAVFPSMLSKPEIYFALKQSVGFAGQDNHQYLVGKQIKSTGINPQV